MNESLASPSSSAVAESWAEVPQFFLVICSILSCKHVTVANLGLAVNWSPVVFMQALCMLSVCSSTEGPLLWEVECVSLFAIEQGPCDKHLSTALGSLSLASFLPNDLLALNFER